MCYAGQVRDDSCMSYPKRRKCARLARIGCASAAPTGILDVRNTDALKERGAVETRSLRELFPQYPQEAPQTLRELVSADSSELAALDDDDRRLAMELRMQAVDAIHAFERDPILCPDDLIRQLTERRIPMLARRWLVMSLDSGGDRIAVRRSRGGGMRWLQEPYSQLPTAEELSEHLRLPQGGKYLVVYGGGPEVLQDQETTSRLEELVKELPISDITFWKLRTGSAPTLFSLRGQAGDQAGEHVDFPLAIPDALTEALRERN